MPALSAHLSKPLAFVACWTVITAVATVLTMVVLFRFHVGVPGGILAALGQTLVLSAVVSWRWWWVLASLGSAVISTILVPVFWTAGGYSQVVMSSVAVLASLPQWLVLRRYGLRSFLWFAVPVLTALATALVYQLQGDLDLTRLYLDEGAAFARWLPTVTIIGAVAGLFQGIALTWILAPEFDRTGSVERSAPRLCPPVAPAVTVSRVAAVRTFLLVLTALVVPIFMPKMFIETWGLPDGEIVPYTLAAAAPWVIALALLRPGLYHAGLALAATASIVTAIGMIPLMAFVTLIAGFVLSGDRHLWVSYAGALAATVTLVIIAVQSIRALRALPESERVEWAWPTALGGCCAYGLLLVATLT